MEDARASDENSIFETSHVLGTLLACSPLLAQSWERCAAADATAASGFLHGGSGTVYVAFSGVHAALSVGPAVAAAESGDVFAPIGLGGDAARPLFAPLVAGEPEETVAVQALALQCFLRLHSSPEFQMLLNQMRGKAVVFTGHSLGGAIAALAALHYLCCLSSSSTSAPAPPILCVTFGSPLVGNKALSRAVLRERWGGNFCHVVSQHDIVPRLLFCPLNTISPHTVIQLQLHQWSASNRHPAALTAVTMPTTETEQEALRQLIQTHTGTTAMEQKLPAPTAPMTQGSSPYRPFGTYVLCSSDGAVCVDNLTVAVQMLYATLMSWRAPITTPEVAHFCYSDLVLQMPQHLLLRHGLRVSDASAAASAYDTGISLALEASGIDIKATEAATARQWLKTSRRSGCSPWQNCASLSTKLGSITPRRAQIEWYKASFDDDTGYYDAFKQRRSPKKYSSANLNRMRLGLFWDTVLAMLESSQLPYDFHRRAKWVNAARFYQLLVEPLDIAEYHRSNLHKTRGAYIAHGRERRYEVFDRWWKDRWWKEMACTGDNAATTRRSKYAGLTQDPCFWARVEEAREWTECLRGERDMTATATATAKKIENLRKFEWYSKELVEKKEVSVDVIAPLSSYTLWVQEWSELKSRDEFKQLFQF